MATLTKKKVIGDILKAEWDKGYCRVSTVLKNDHASAVTKEVTDPVGYPIKMDGTDYVLCQATEEADCIGIIVEGPTIEELDAAKAEATDNKYALLVRGPARIAKDALPTTDSEGASYTTATLVTALEALNVPVIVQVVPTKSSTQAT